jgi:ketosteroid isomerase-like protein
MERSAEISDLIQRFLEKFTAGDESIVELMSHDNDVTVIGTDPREWMVGSADVERVLTAQVREIHDARITITPGERRAFQAGSVGWGVSRPVFRMPDGSDIPVRFTMVARQENGSWKIMQVHASIGVTNEEVLDQKLTV